MGLALTQGQKDAKTAKQLAALGIKMPRLTIDAARATKTPLPIACAMLMMETGGGRNVYGHDPVLNSAPKGGVVTEDNYRVYVVERKAGRGMQGVGPTQLTWYSYQDAADKIGGCWKPSCNLRIGFALVNSHVRRYGVARGFAAYNGSGSAARKYGARAETLHRQFTVALGTKPPAPKKRLAAALTLRNWWKAYVYGDTDCERALLVKLAIVARARGKGYKVFVRCGTRTYAEQAALYAHYKRVGSPLTARPGTSNHEAHPPSKVGKASDCQLVDPNGHQVNIGDDALARKLLTKNGLTLPVPGESWHVERKV